MGCGGSSDEARNVTIKKKPLKAEESKPMTEKQKTINKIFEKDKEDSVVNEPPRQEYKTPKHNLRKRSGPVVKNVNVLIDDNTKVWDLSS